MKEKLEKSNISDKNNKKETHNKCNINTIIFLIIFLINIIFMCFSLIFTTHLFNHPHKLQGRNINEYYNNYCQNNKNESEKLYNLICTNKYFKHEYKKNKFIWIMTDGTAYDQLVELHNLYKYKITTSFKVLSKRFKMTDELHQAIITGKRNRNFYGSNIDFDNILQQVVGKGNKLNYRGWTEPIPSIIGENEGGSKDGQFFYKKFIDDGHEYLNFYSFCNFTNPFPFLKLNFDTYQKYENLNNNYIYSGILKSFMSRCTDKSYHLRKNISKEIFFEELDDFFKEYPIDLFTVNISNCLEKSFEWNQSDNISILYYTTENDHLNHLFGKSHGYAIVSSYITEKMILNLMKWIDNNNDYALIITTDHGGQDFYGEDFIRNHGEDIPGNEGIFYIYTKELKDNFDELNVKEKYIDIRDESAIIPQILYDINIPLHSEGIPYSIINDNVLAYSALKAKEVQLLGVIDSYTKKYGGKYDNLLEIKDKITYSLNQFEWIEDIYFNNNSYEIEKQFKNIIARNLENIKNWQNKITKKINKKNRTFKNIIIFIILFILCLLKSAFEIIYLLKQIFNNHFNSLSFKNKKKLLYIIVISITIFFLLFPMLIPYLFFKMHQEYKFEFLVIGSLLCSLLNLIIVFLIFKPKKIFDKKYKNTLYLFMFILFGIIFFTIFAHYSYIFYNIKEYYSRYARGKILDILIIYPMFISQIIYEMKKYKRIFFYFGEKRKIKILYIMIGVNSLFLLFVFIQDMTVNLYHQNQININKVVNIFSFIIFLIYVIISNFLFFTKIKPKENINNASELEKRKSFDSIQNSDNKFIINKDVMNIVQETNNDLLKTSGNNINNPVENINSNNMTLKVEKPKKDFQIGLINGLPCIKLCLLNLCFWLTDESERIYFLLFLIPTLEYFDYLADFFYKKMICIMLYPIENNNDKCPNTVIINLNKKEIDNKDNKKMYKKYDEYISSCIFFILAHNTFIHLNHVIFLLTQRNYEPIFPSRQKQKTIYNRGLTLLVKYVGKYKFSFAIIGYIMSRRNLLINKKLNNYSFVFTFPRILLFLRNNFDLIFFSSFTLINVDNDIFIHLLILFHIDLIMIVVDMIGLMISKLSYLIYVLTLKNFKDIILVNSFYNDYNNHDFLNEICKNKIN